MDPDLMALASTAGRTVVGLLATDAWATAKTAVGEFWRRARPDQAEVIAAELVTAHEELVAALAQGDSAVGQSLTGEWQTKLRRVLTGEPHLAAEMRRLLDEKLIPAMQTAQQAPGIVRMTATALDQGRVYQANRDQFITGQH